MQITILGAGTAIPTPEHSPAGVLVRVGVTPLLFDMGPGTIARLAAAGVSYRDLEYIFLTHLHSDHTLDLVTFLQANDSTPGWTRTRPVHLLGSRGVQTFYAQLMQVYPGIAPQSYALDIRELGAERVSFGAWTIETAMTGHTGSSVSYRVEAEGKAIIYTGDAKDTPDLAHLARDADVFVCECAFPRGNPTTDHMTADAVGRVARAADAKRVVLTHLYPPAFEVDIAAQVRAEFAGEIILAVDGMR
ncbi:MAG: MBL fold metallo-hydrolase, partial [Anaerolineales bacterium]|nr:MBL fold metallo-hydrolase [Anaerolineales bacterium]